MTYRLYPWIGTAWIVFAAGCAAGADAGTEMSDDDDDVGRPPYTSASYVQRDRGEPKRITKEEEKNRLQKLLANAKYPVLYTLCTILLIQIAIHLNENRMSTLREERRLWLFLGHGAIMIMLQKILELV